LKFFSLSSYCYHFLLDFFIAIHSLLDILIKNGTDMLFMMNIVHQINTEFDKTFTDTHNGSISHASKWMSVQDAKSNLSILFIISVQNMQKPKEKIWL
jgi:hypothetical protein